MKCVALVATLLLILPESGHSQGRWVQRSTTRIENFQARTGTVIIRAFSTVGVAHGFSDGLIRVEYDGFTDIATGDREYGVVLYLQAGREQETHNGAFIDYDEIDSLLRGIDYLSKTSGSSADLPTFEATCRSRGGIEIATFGDRGGSIKASVTATFVNLAGSETQTRVMFELSNLAYLGQLIASARAKLDTLREGPK